MITYAGLEYNCKYKAYSTFVIPKLNKCFFLSISHILNQATLQNICNDRECFTNIQLIKPT